MRTTVTAGTHTVLVAYAGNQTPSMQVDLAADDEALLILTFGSVSALVAEDMLTPWKERIRQPVGKVPPGFMTLSRSS